MEKKQVGIIISYIFCYGIAMAAILFYYFELPTLFYWCSGTIGGFGLLTTVIPQIICNKSWRCCFKIIAYLSLATLLGCLITHWEPIDGALLGLCLFQLIGSFFEYYGKAAKSKDSVSGEKPTIQTEQNDESYPECDNISEKGFATKIEMKDEAIARMKLIGLYQEIIDDFINAGNIQIYEPPYGAGYHLEKDEKKLVRTVEKKRDILVWGIARSFIKFGGKDNIVDNMFFVSKNKEYWDIERSNLADKVPNVYAYNHDFPHFSEEGSISIYMSPGGTPLRQ